MEIFFIDEWHKLVACRPGTCVVRFIYSDRVDVTAQHRCCTISTIHSARQSHAMMMCPTIWSKTTYSLYLCVLEISQVLHKRYITCSTVVLQCYRRQAIRTEQVKIRHSVTLYSLDRSLPKFVQLITSATPTHMQILVKFGLAGNSPQIGDFL